MENKEVMQMALDALITAELDGNCEYGATDALRTALAQPEKKWVGLTDEEIESIYATSRDVNYEYERAIEAKLKEKNYD